MAVVRPKFNPSRCNAATDVDVNPLRLDGNKDDDATWTPLITCPADFPAALFEHAVSQLIHHPEYNSTLILRSEVIQDSVAGFPDLVPALRDLQPVRNIHRKLLPRRPTRDPAIEQHCTLYAPSNSHLTDAAESLHPTVLVLTPLLPPDGVLPYYHPTVTHLAFRFIPTTTPPSNEAAAAAAAAAAATAALRIEVIPLPGTSLDPGARLYRTCLSLLETLHRYGWGTLTQYKKRVLHDVLVPRETYQDLYLVMRERHKHLINEWREVTDPLKHVFEDIGIATFLMLLWKDTYGPETIPPDPAPVATSNTPEAQAAHSDAEPWRRWPRPPGGFIDLGCGNGLLTHILISEGYAGYGFDLRARTSWIHYPRATQSHLLVHALDPTAPTRVLPMKHHQQNRRDPVSSSQPPDTSNNDDGDDEEEEEANSTSYNGDGGSSSSSSSGHGCVEGPDVLLPTGCFLIGNHADELTPWIPLLATRHLASGYLSIPCCAWSFDARFDRARDVPLCAVDTESLNLGADGAAGSSYAQYRIWLAALSVHCGWSVEVEILRIPSTRNWAIVGRRRVGFLEAADRNVEELIQGVRKRGQFKTRRPEGKAGDH